MIPPLLSSHFKNTLVAFDATNAWFNMKFLCDF